MRAGTAILVFGFITVLCLLLSGFVIGYFLKEWKKLDHMLEDY